MLGAQYCNGERRWPEAIQPRCRSFIGGACTAATPQTDSESYIPRRAFGYDPSPARGCNIEVKERGQNGDKSEARWHRCARTRCRPLSVSLAIQRSKALKLNL